MTKTKVAVQVSEIGPLEYDYIVVAGKHSYRSDKGLFTVRAGDHLIMTEAEAAKFPNKFRQVVKAFAIADVPVSGDVKESTSAVIGESVDIDESAE